MNKFSTYLASLLVSVLLVICTLASSAALPADINVNYTKAVAVAEEKDITAKVHDELEKYYTQKFGSSGIPADVYMEGLTDDYISQCVKICISSTFSSLSNGSGLQINLPKNEELEKSISDFFEDYADKAGYEKDEKFSAKVSDTIRSAYQTVRSHSDIYKASSLQEHKVLGRLSKIYRKRTPLTAIVIGADILLVILLVLINRKKKITVLYWTGISAIIAGLAGAVPSAVLLLTKYYDSFSIKQPAVFTAYTGAMYKMTEAFMAVCISAILVGISLTVIYTITYDRSKRQNVKPTEL